MKMMYKKLNVFCLVVLLAGCGGGAITPATTSSVKNLASESQVKQQMFDAVSNQYPARDHDVVIPKDALWLGDARKAHFKQGAARTLIRALAVPHPVKFNVADDDDPVVYSPPAAVILKDYFDSFAVQSNWSYKVANGVLIFSDWESRTIPLAALVGEASTVLKSTNGAGVAAQENKLVVSTDAYAEIEKIVAEILHTPDNPEPVFPSTIQPIRRSVDDLIVPDLGADTAVFRETYPSPASAQAETRVARYSVSRAANMLFVSAAPNEIREVLTAMERYNASVSKRVVIDVTVYDVTLADGDKRSLNLNLLRAAAGTLASVGTGDALTIARVSSATERARNQTIIFDWVESHGTISKRIHRRFETLNNHAVTFLDTAEIEYVKKIALVQQTSGATSSVTPEVEIGAHQIGRAFNLFATIIDDRVNIQMTINDRRIGGRETYSLGSAGEGTLLNILNIDKVIPLSLRNGETRVLTYFQDESTETNHTRNKVLPVLLDGKNDRVERSETVIVISADVVG